MNAENINNNFEITSSSAEETESRAPSKLKKIGKKIMEISGNAIVPTGAIHGLVNTAYEHSLPPHYAVGGSLIAGIALGVGVDKIRGKHKERKARKDIANSPSVSPEIIESSARPE
jgi:hypothetical protein